MIDPREKMREEAPFRTGEIVRVAEGEKVLLEHLGAGGFVIERTQPPRIDDLDCDCGAPDEPDAIHRLDCRHMRPARWWIMIRSAGRSLRLAANFFRRSSDEPGQDE